MSSSGIYSRKRRIRPLWARARVRPRTTYLMTRGGRKKPVVKYSGYKKGGLGNFPIPRSTFLRFNGPGLLPMTYRTNMRFNATGALTTAGGFYDWIFRGNSIYDPDYSVGGTTCSGFDAMSRLYTYYKVLSSTIQLTITNNDTDDPLNVTIIPNIISASFVVGDVNDIPAQPYSRSIIVTNQVGQGKIGHYCTTAAACNVKDVDDTTFKGTMTTNPTEQFFWHCVFSNRAGNALACEVNIQMSYTVEFSGLKAATQTH